MATGAAAGEAQPWQRVIARQAEQLKSGLTAFSVSLFFFVVGFFCRQIPRCRCGWGSMSKSPLPLLLLDLFALASFRIVRSSISVCSVAGLPFFACSMNLFVWELWGGGGSGNGSWEQEQHHHWPPVAAADCAVPISFGCNCNCNSSNNQAGKAAAKCGTCSRCSTCITWPSDKLAASRGCNDCRKCQKDARHSAESKNNAEKRIEKGEGGREREEETKSKLQYQRKAESTFSLYVGEEEQQKIRKQDEAAQPRHVAYPSQEQH